MSTITLPNIRVSSDLTVSVRLKDNGVAIDWSTLNNVKASIYSDAQRALAGRCDVSVDAEDPTVLVCQYAANKPQYVGVCRIVVSAKYMGETKTYDKPAFNFVRWTADQDGEQITIDDPDVDVEIDVADVSSALLDEAIRAAFTAAEEAVDAKGQVLETEAEVEAAEALRVSAEESRVEAEEGRVEAEAARVDEEAVRVSAEDARVVAENARAAAEDLREGAEDDRAAAETARETAEAARVAAEALRVTAEGSRETAEAAREAQASADHTVAAGDHTQAAADHTQAAADHTTAASDHTQAGADHTLAAADHVTAGEDHAQAQDDHEVMAGYDTRLGNVEGEVSQLEAKVDYNEVNTRYNYIPGLYAGYPPKELLRDTIHGLSEPIIVNKGDEVVWSCGTTDTFTMCLFCYDEFGNKVDDWTNNSSSGIRVISNIMSAGTQNRYILRASFLLANAANAYVKVNGVRVWEPGVLFDAETEYNSLKERMMQFRFDGSGTTYVSQKVFNLVPGNRYRLYPKSSTWNHSSAPSELFILGVEAYVGSSKTDLVAVRQGQTVSDYYDFVAPENDYILIGIRADVGEEVYLNLVDITLPYSLIRDISLVDERVSLLGEDVSLLNEKSDTQVVKLTGNNVGFVSKTITLQKGRYIVFFGGTWGKTSVGTNGALFEIEVDGKFVVRCNVANASDLQDCYFIEFNDEVSAIVGLRADSGNKVSVYFQNLTSVSQYLSHNNYQTSFDKAEGREFLFLGKSFVQADTATSGGTGSVNNYRVSQASLLEIPYPKAKLHFKLPNHIFAKMTFGDYSFQLNNEISWVSNGQTLEVPEKVLYYRLTFARSTTLVASIGGTVAGSSALSVEEIVNYINRGEIAITFDNISVFSACAQSEQKLKVCMRNYTQSYSSDRDKGFNYYPTILHLTDTHGDAVRIRRALQYAKMLNVETIVLTGDIVCGDTRNGATYLKDIEDECGIDIYPCIGNHDTYGTAVYDNGGEIGVNPAYRQWNTITKNVLTKPNVVSPTGITYPTYYHFDDTTRKLRFIALNLYEKGRDYTYSGAIYVSQQQINWLIGVLASTPQDYGVFIMMHQPEEGITKDNSYDKFFGVEYYNPQTKLTGNPIRKIIDAFIGKTTIADSYTQFVDGISGEQETISYSADFTNVSSGVDFIAYLTGHEHFDKIGYVTGAEHKQLMLNITCTEAGYGNNYVSAANISELPRENGSTQDAITIYVVDRDNKRIRLARLGSVITSEFTERDYLIIPFKD